MNGYTDFDLDDLSENELRERNQILVDRRNALHTAKNAAIRDDRIDDDITPINDILHEISDERHAILEELGELD